MAKLGDLVYGPLMITAGRYKGTVGCCDDTVGRMAYVYLGAPFVSPAGWIYWEWLESLKNVSSIKIEDFRRANPPLCALMGV